MSLRLDASDDDMLALRQTLRLFSERTPKPFAALFSPSERHSPAPLDESVAVILAHFGLLEHQGGVVWSSAHRIRVVGERFYVMELGVNEYHQDIWPETDSLLDVLPELPKGRLLDMGTGSGVVAIEAAVRGHSVVATDLYRTALDLAGFNARLNGVTGIDFRQGDLFAPVAEETFDAILTAPHYTRVADQIRHRALLDAPDRLAPDGLLFVATFLEWEGDETAPFSTVEVLLRPRTDLTVHIEPIVSATKASWFAQAVPELLPGEPDLGSLVSRQRFLLRIRRAPPPEDAINIVRGRPNRHTFIPLSRLTLGLDGALSTARDTPIAVVHSDEDVARVRQIVAQIDAGVVSLSGAIPGEVLDACRFGKSICVSFDDNRTGAAGAILGLDGGVRPCAHGSAIGVASDTLAELVDKQRTLAAATAERRGCATCPAEAHCSRCLFPVVLDDQAYCDLVRSAGPSWPSLARVWELVEQLDRMKILGRRLRIKLRPAPALLAARARPMPQGDNQVTQPDLAEPLAALRARMQTTQAWLISVDAARFFAYYFVGEKPWILKIERAEAALAELCAEGAGPAEVESWARSEFLPPSVYRQTLLRVYDLFA